VRVRAYQARITSGADLIADGGTPSGQTPVGEGMVQGPYVAETYPVSVEHDYIVVDLSSR